MWNKFQKNKNKSREVSQENTLQQSRSDTGLNYHGNSGHLGKRLKIHLNVEFIRQNGLYIEVQSKGGIKDDSLGFWLEVLGDNAIQYSEW